MKINIKNSEKMFSVLIVEDNAVDMLVVKTLLEKEFNVFCATNGLDAIVMNGKHRFDVILLDINLGVGLLNGIQVMKTIRDGEKNNDVKIFAVTAFYEDEDFLLEKGFDGLFTKPVLKEELIEAIINFTHAG